MRSRSSLVGYGLACRPTSNGLHRRHQRSSTTKSGSTGPFKNWATSSRLRQLRCSVSARRVTLIRRAYLDLVGLPPSPEQVDQFLADTAPDAFERLIDQLVQSPQFGERWARYWLDVAGYADTVGFDQDAALILQAEGKWRYRDYVIDAFNADKPYDQFITEQLAGDEMNAWREAECYTDEMREQLIATGFLRTARDQSHEPESNIPLCYFDVLHDTIQIVGNSLLGLTMECARCHTHKFDPIPQEDYYRLMAIFTPAYNPDSWKPVHPYKPYIDDRALLDRSGKIQALFDVGPPPPTFLLKRGDYRTPGREVLPGFLRVLCASDAAAMVKIEQIGNGSSGRRTALARWLTDADTPAGALLARVMVNRIWQHLLGAGLVATPGNFGTEGERPTHPELLEWLSRRFVDGGWKIKPLIKQIMTSGVYQQTSQSRIGEKSPSNDGHDSTSAGRDPMSIDPENKLLWRMRLRRLEAEIVRDSILSVSGKLDTSAGGPPVMVMVRADGKVVIDESKLLTPTAKWRRSIYLLVRRAYNLSLLSVFDQPFISTTCARRDTSAVPLQSLTMLNDEFVAEHARYFADRLLEQKSDDSATLITAAYRIALARPPDGDELSMCTASLARQALLYRESGVSAEQARQQALTELCHTLFNTSEFLYAE